MLSDGFLNSCNSLHHLSSLSLNKSYLLLVTADNIQLNSLHPLSPLNTQAGINGSLCFCFLKKENPQQNKPFAEFQAMKNTARTSQCLVSSRSLFGSTFGSP